jgi:hypothetical protein
MRGSSYIADALGRGLARGSSHKKEKKRHGRRGRSTG